MSVSRQASGRIHQKERTRAALVAAASDLFRRQVPPTIEEAARAAKISRATAYRYFPTQESLLLEVATITPIFEPVDREVADIPDRGAPERLGALVDVMARTVFTHEAHMRTALRVYMDQWIGARRRGEPEPPPIRVRRRLRYLDLVLSDLRERFTPAHWRRLRSALALTMGPETLLVMKDVCRLSEDESMEVLRWAGLALLQAGLREADKELRAPRPRSRLP